METLLSKLMLVVTTNNFEITPTLMTMIQTSIQYKGHPNDDLHSHIENFLEIYDTLKFNGVRENAIKLRLFPFLLQDKAKSWFISLPLGLVTT